MSDSLVVELADQVELMHRTGAVFAMQINDCLLTQRQAFLNHLQAAMLLLRRRGHRVRATVVWEDDVEYITLQISDPYSQSVEQFRDRWP